MQEQIFDLSTVRDGNSKMTRLPDYQMIKRRFFELAKPIIEKEYSMSKFHEEYVAPNLTETIRLTVGETRNWIKMMMPDALRLVGMMTVNDKAQDTMTLLEREQEKVKKQFEIRQDVTELMWSYIKKLRQYIEDPDISKHLEGKEYLKLYEIIRLEEDRAKAMSLKERSENRADAMFAWMVSQAKAGQLEAADIDLLEDDVKKDLLIFKGENGIYQLPTGSIPKIKFAAEVATAQPAQSDK